MASRLRSAARLLTTAGKGFVSSYATQPSPFPAAVARAGQRSLPRGKGWTLKDLLTDFNKLSKGKLSFIVMTTSAAGFVLGSGESVEWSKLAWTCVGTWACSAAANTCNQIYEIRNDSFMKRTMLRPLPSGRMPVVVALGFAAVTGLGGAFVLQTQVHPITAGLGVANIALYASIYTPLKQMHPINTWVGAVVGAVPPLMGWTAATGSIDPGAMFMASVLYFWQLPHFMALAWLCKDDYARGGHRMLSLFDPTGRRTAGVALRNALYLVPLGLFAVAGGLVHPVFTYESCALSCVLALSASAFYTKPSSQTARLLFRMSLMHLPLYMVCAMVHRLPNTERVTWDQAIKYLQSGAESVEEGLYERVHGTETDERCGSMLFPFSPPLIMPAPCPYSIVKQSLAVPEAAAADSDSSSSGASKDDRSQVRSIRQSQNVVSKG